MLMSEVNYIGVFLTFRCYMGCTYCLNRQGSFANRKEMGYEHWIPILQALETRPDLPISLQGGEPTLYRDFYPLVQELHKMGKPMDLLTNGDFDVDEFIEQTTPEMFKRPAPYASIRFSFHKNTQEIKLLRTVRRLHRRGYSVGIWGLSHPTMVYRNRLLDKMCKAEGIDYREKEYLDSEHGTYKYPDAVTGLKNINVTCHPSEILLAPDGNQFPCHYFLYSGKDPQWNVGGSVACRNYGLCNPCDVKLKTNRLQEGGHCSVRIEGV